MNEKTSKQALKKTSKFHTMKYMISVLISLCSCATIRMNESNREFEFFNNDISATVWFNYNKPIEHYQNFNIKFYKYDIDYGKYNCPEKK